MFDCILTRYGHHVTLRKTLSNVNSRPLCGHELTDSIEARLHPALDGTRYLSNKSGGTSVQMAVTTIAIVDDHPLLAEGLAAVLGRYDHLSVVATGNKADDILSIIDDYQPDIILVDINMPGDAFAVLNEVRVRACSTRAIVFTASTSTDHAVSALAAGAAGFVLKGSQANELVEAIEAVCEGEVFISPSFAAKVIGALQAKEAEKRAAERLKLSVREEQIVRLLLCGKQNREIALALNLSEKTIKSYMSNLMTKLHVRNRLEVVIAAQRFMPGDQQSLRGL